MCALAGAHVGQVAQSRVHVPALGPLHPPLLPLCPGTSQSDPLPVGACKELKAKLPKEKSGWKYVKTKSSGVIKVWCDQETAGGGWMLTLMMSTNGKNSASGHYFPIMSKRYCSRASPFVHHRHVGARRKVGGISALRRCRLRCVDCP